MKNIALTLSLLFFGACSDAEQKPNKEQSVKTEKPQKTPAPPAKATIQKPNINVDTSNSCDEFMKEYSEFVDTYISYMKKASKGDMSAMSDAQKKS
jgi:hypothetical protein